MFESESPIMMYEKNIILFIEPLMKSCVDTRRSSAKEISTVSWKIRIYGARAISVLILSFLRSLKLSLSLLNFSPARL